VLGEQWRVRVDAELLEQLQRRIGPVEVRYGIPGAGAGSSPGNNPGSSPGNSPEGPAGGGLGASA